MPWWQHRLTSNPEDLQANCERCMKNITRKDRQLVGCGFEPPPVSLPVVPWEPPRSRLGYQGPELTTCPGYTTSLPEVYEAVEARMHWSKGQLELYCEGRPTKPLLSAILCLEAEATRYQSWATTPTHEGGGRS